MEAAPCPVHAPVAGETEFKSLISWWSMARTSSFLLLDSTHLPACRVRVGPRYPLMSRLFSLCWTAWSGYPVVCRIPPWRTCQKKYGSCLPPRWMVYVCFRLLRAVCLNVNVLNPCHWESRELTTSLYETRRFITHLFKLYYGLKLALLQQWQVDGCSCWCVLESF